MNQFKVYSNEELQDDLEKVAELITNIKTSYPADGNERRLLLLIKNAAFFVYLHHRQSFIDFLRQSEEGLSVNQLRKLKELGISFEDEN